MLQHIVVDGSLLWHIYVGILYALAPILMSSVTHCDVNMNFVSNFRKCLVQGLGFGTCT